MWGSNLWTHEVVNSSNSWVDLMTQVVRSWPEPKPRVKRLTNCHPGTPKMSILSLCTHTLSSFLFLFLNLFTVYLFWERERESVHVRGGGAEREGEREFQAGSTLSAVPSPGLDLTNDEIITRAEIKSQSLNQLSHAGTPLFCFFLFKVIFLLREITVRLGC